MPALHLVLPEIHQFILPPMFFLLQTLRFLFRLVPRVKSFLARLLLRLTIYQLPLLHRLPLSETVALSQLSQ